MNGRREPRTAGVAGRAARWALAVGLAAALTADAWPSPPFTTTDTVADAWANTVAEAGGAGEG
ncbi:hypothetical protein ABGB09_28955, partial [Streptomyces sp. B8F3]